jgi:putative nucleotidyltransferase with HDIG domain
MDQLPKFIQEAIRNEPHFPNKYHFETLYEHLIRCADNCKRLAKEFDVPEDLAYFIGLLHDIGKPFTRCNLKKKNVSYTGHSQIGAYLISRLNIENKDVLTFTTNNHMCCCSHLKGLNTLIQFKSLLQITLPDTNRELCIRSLALLFAADLLSRDCEMPNNEEDVLEYSKEFIRIFQIENNTEIVRKICIQKKGSNDKVIVLPLGTSGCGKSTFSKTIPDATIIERDQCYYQVAKDNNFIGGNYQETYNFVGELENGKELVQKLFIKRIADALEDPEIKVLIVDTMQTLFGPAWKGTLEQLPEDSRANYSSALKIGVYLFPQNEFGITFEPKTGEYSKYPNQKIIFPKVNLETGIWDPMEIDIGIGDPSIVPMIIQRFLSETIIPSVPEQGTVLKMGFTPYQIINQFPPGIVNVTEEFDNQYYKIVTLNYLDGYQIFHRTNT